MNGMRECVEVVVTGEGREWAEEFARVLVEERWAACIHVTEIRSVYRWEGAVEHGPEMRLALHTRADLVEALSARIVELHPYDVPCVMALPLVGGLPGYLEWIAQETRDT